MLALYVATAKRMGAPLDKLGGKPGVVMTTLVTAAEADATRGEMQSVLFEIFGRNK